LGKFDKNINTNYHLKKEGNGVYAFVLKGDFAIDGSTLNLMDGLGLTGRNSFSIEAKSDDAEILLMEVPMQV